MPTDPIDTWHQIVQTRDAAQLDALLSEDVVFHSPIRHAPQVGRPLTAKYLRAALRVLSDESFRYVRELRGPRDALLEFRVELDGIDVNGVDLIRWDDDGKIVDFKVMLRPLKAMDVVQRKMAEALQER